MNKIYNIILVVFATIALVSCSDDDKNDTTPAWNDPSAQYVDYAFYTAKSMGYAGNVKMVERTNYDRSSIDSANNIIKAIRSIETSYFDPNGALIKRIIPMDYEDNGLIKYSEITYSYDSLYRIKEIVESNINYNTSIKKYNYDERRNEATIEYYNQYNGFEADLQNKYVYKLNSEGRIDPDEYDYYEQDYSRTKQRSTEPDATTNYTRKVERDSKNNILVNYFILKSNDYNDNFLYSHYEQTITYYDGTVSKPSGVEVNGEINPINLYTASGYGYKGNIKKAVLNQYTSNITTPIVMNSNTGQISGGQLYYKRTSEFNNEGFALNEEKINYRYYSIYNGGYSVSFTYKIDGEETSTYELDSQNRVKVLYIKSKQYSYPYKYDSSYNYYQDFDNPTISTANRKRVFTYDDVNNTVTEETYNLDIDQNNTMSASDNTKSDIQTKNSGDNFYLSGNQKLTKILDSNGNSTLEYYLSTSYNTQGLISNQKISEYTTNDITYY